jgi:hypothetical protein
MSVVNDEAMYQAEDFDEIDEFEPSAAIALCRNVDTDLKTTNFDYVKFNIAPRRMAKLLTAGDKTTLAVDVAFTGPVSASTSVP